MPDKLMCFLTLNLSFSESFSFNSFSILTNAVSLSFCKFSLLAMSSESFLIVL